MASHRDRMSAGIRDCVQTRAIPQTRVLGDFSGVMGCFEKAGTALVTGVSGTIAFADIDEDRARNAATASQPYASIKCYHAEAWELDVTNQASVDRLVHAGVRATTRNYRCAAKQYSPGPENDPAYYDRVMSGWFFHWLAAEARHSEAGNESQYRYASIGTIGSMENSKINVAILGGGIAGLTLGLGLAKNPHVDFHIYETVPEYKDIGAGLALHLNAIKAMALVGNEVKQAYVDRALNMGDADVEMATQVILASGPNSGEVVAELGRAKGRKTVARHELMKGFMELLPKDSISNGKSAEKIEESDRGVTVYFKDGSQVEADCVIGADGVHSITRAHVLGADHPAVGAKNHDGYQNYRRMMSMDEARKYGIDEKWTYFVPILCGPRGNINSMPLDKGRKLSVGLAVRGLRFEADKYSGAPPLKDQLHVFDDYSEEAKKMVRMVADDTSGSWSYADHDHAPIYYKGRTCMIGDAAHTMHPFAGQGAAQAIEDCAVMTHLFSEVSSPSQVEKALAAYDKIRRPRSQHQVDLSRKHGDIYNYAADGMENDPEAMRAFFKESASFSNNADLQAQNDNAMKAFKESL
ncbi:hypothetical protein DOTSEDRAFT_80005 [Dothistroma septosporum NZE10]|uniref:FAD-binding domain-containing protein n=1 Tax=Dothistroma septosporum (strain NZE10 / CBS 128990) TaxID=675120 RepID=N1PLF8_DOTSN|nr:hypothetical protein DOTSEDRAFT_80005 [Dothistroma septosporum NZE10]